MKEQNQKLKLLVLGDHQVGKTSFLKMFIDKQFSEVVEQTIGVDFCATQYISEDGSMLKLQFWEFAGGARYQELSKDYYKNCSGAFVIFDVGNENSFKNVPFWIDRVKEFGQSNGPIILLGNKIDQYSNNNLRKVKTEEAQTLANQYHAHYMEIDVKTNYNVGISVKEMVKEIQIIKANEVKNNSQ